MALNEMTVPSSLSAPAQNHGYRARPQRSVWRYVSFREIPDAPVVTEPRAVKRYDSRSNSQISNSRSTIGRAYHVRRPR